MHTPLVTIIIPVYKVEQYLHRCVDSVINQTYKNLKIILVDDGSPDNCPTICDEYESKDKRIIVIHKENGGLSSARNAGLDFQHNGDFIFFLDSDDFIHNRTIETLIYIQEECNADIVQCKFIRGSESEFPLIGVDFNYNIYDNLSIFYSKEHKVTLWAKLYKTCLWDGIRMPIGKINEDDATYWKLYYKCKIIATTPIPMYYYYINPHSIMANKKSYFSYDFIEHYHERINFFRNKDLILYTQLSQWRFCLTIMLQFLNNIVITKNQRKLLWNEFLINYVDVLKCSKVPIFHKCLFMIFRIAPNICRLFLGAFKVHDK